MRRVRVTRNVPDEFLEYFELAQDVKYLPSEIGVDAITMQYIDFSNVVKEAYEAIIKVTPALSDKFEKLEQQIYNRIKAGGASSHIDVTDLLLSSLTRAQCEGVCESMGSVLKNVVDDRNLDFENLRHEMFVAYNGPKPYEDCVNDLIDDALNDHLKGSKWHFYRRTKEGSLLTHWNASQVIDRKKNEATAHGRILYKPKDMR